MNKLVFGVLAALSLVAAPLALAAPAEAASGSRFWVYNNSGYQIDHVYADRDTSGGQRDLLGSSGTLPSYDQALTLRVKTNHCISNVAVVNEYDDWVWFYDVNICRTDGVRVDDGDFPDYD